MKKIILAATLAVTAWATAGQAAMSIQDTISYGRSPWSYSLFSLATLGMDQVHDGGARLSSYNYLSMNHRLSRNTRWSFHIPFTYSTYGYDQFSHGQNEDQSLDLQDVFFSYTNYELALLPGDIEAYWEGRIYVPTSKTSRQQKMITRLRSTFILTRPLAQKVELEYINQFDDYDQSQTAYMSSSGYVNVTKRYHLNHWLELWYAFNADTGVGFQIGQEETWYNKSSVEHQSRPAEELAKLGPSLRFSASYNLNFILELTDNVDVHKEMSQLGHFKGQNTEVALLSFVRF